jgi:hypothetical protein
LAAPSKLGKELADELVCCLGPRLLLVALASFPMIIQPFAADAQMQNARMQGVRLLAREPPSQKPQVAMNAWTVGVAGGLLEGAPIRLPAEIARVVDDGHNLHVLPIVTRGATENVNSLLYLRGIDAAIINSDALEEYKSQVPDIQQRLAYILNLFPSELHIFVRPEIQSLNDLAGKKVNFNTQGTAAAYSGPLIFSRLGLEVEKTFIPHQVALEQMRRGEMAGVVRCIVRGGAGERTTPVITNGGYRHAPAARCGEVRRAHAEARPSRCHGPLRTRIHNASFDIAGEHKRRCRDEPRAQQRNECCTVL